MRESEKGQISIMIGVMMTTFIFFLAFVINTGMLVNAKINLQNAADLAAYAGAATQARQLTQISYINYEMRRQWKKFLFRIYVLGNMSQDNFPRSPGTGSMTYKPNSTNSTDYTVPTTCISFNPKDDNYCHNVTLAQVSIPPDNSFGLDAIMTTLRGQLQAIETIRQDNCKSIGQTNKMVNLYWLFNTDPTLTSMAQSSSLSPDQAGVIQAIRTLSVGLGIVPREVLLRMRISTLTDYVNSPANQSLDFQTAEGLSKVSDPSLNERALQAFYSAYYSLGNHTFAPESIFLDEMLPAGSANNSNLLALKEIKTEFDTYTIDMALTGQALGAQSNGQSPADCETRIVPVALAAPLTLGVYKDPTVLTYYAVRLRATANLLFSPFGPMDLKAYAAARPFGSRIGPSSAEFVSPPSTALASLPAFTLGAPLGSPNLSYKIPNIPVKLTDTSQRGNGWDTQIVLGNMYQFLINASGGGSRLSITNQSLQVAYQAAMAPNPWEARQYNIMNDNTSAGESFSIHFDQSGGVGQSRFWAPIVAPGKQGNLAQTIQSEVQAIMNSTQTYGNLGSAGASAPPGSSGNAAALASITSALSSGLTHFVTSLLPQGQDEDGNPSGGSINIFRMSNPFVWNGPTGVTPIGGDPTLFLSNDPKLVRTSWNLVNDSTIRSQGRTGYSVKFVTFQSLPGQGGASGQSSYTNSVWTDTDAEGDLPLLQH